MTEATMQQELLNDVAQMEPEFSPVQPDRVAQAVADLLEALQVDEGDHTAQTPARVAKAWRHMLSGYEEDPSLHLLKQFSAPPAPGLIVVSGVRLVSTCAHHLLPITGHATVAYRPRPGQSVVGLSKLSRVVEGYARRLQVQERIGSQVVDAIVDKLDPAGAVCLITAEHGCMTLRGVECPESRTLTVATSPHWKLSQADVQVALAEHQRH